jgi:hypothetical protein
MLAVAGVTAMFHKGYIRTPVPEESGKEFYPFLDASAYVEGLRRVPPDVPAFVLNDTFFSKHPSRS